MIYGKKARSVNSSSSRYDLSAADPLCSTPFFELQSGLEG